MNEKTYEFEAVIQNVEGLDGAFVKIPFSVKDEFNKGRVPVSATFDGVGYEGSVVNMGIKNPDGSVCHIIGIRRDIRTRIGKQPGDTVRVTLAERETHAPSDGGATEASLAVPEELLKAMESDDEAKAFFESLSIGYKRGYCDWVGGAKQKNIREVRAGKALAMLRKKQKTLKT